MEAVVAGCLPFIRDLKSGMKQIHMLLASLGLALPCMLLIGQQNSHESTSAHANLYPPAEIQWKDGPPTLPKGAKIAVLEGDPTKEGMFVMRVRAPDGF